MKHTCKYCGKEHNGGQFVIPSCVDQTINSLNFKLSTLATIELERDLLKQDRDQLQSLINDGPRLLRTQWNILLPVIEETFTHKANLNTVKLERDEALVKCDSLKSQLAAAEKARDDYAAEIYRLAEELRIRREKRQVSNKGSISPNQ